MSITDQDASELHRPGAEYAPASYDDGQRENDYDVPELTRGERLSWALSQYGPYLGEERRTRLAEQQTTTLNRDDRPNEYVARLRGSIASMDNEIQRLDREGSATGLSTELERYSISYASVVEGLTSADSDIRREARFSVVLADLVSPSELRVSQLAAVLDDADAGRAVSRATDGERFDEIVLKGIAYRADEHAATLKILNNELERVLGAGTIPRLGELVQALDTSSMTVEENRPGVSTGDRQGEIRMANKYPISFEGNLTGDPVYGESGRTKYANFNVAVNSREYDEATKSYVDGPTDYHRVTAFGKQAENVRETFQKGDPVIVLGKLEFKDYVDKEGVSREGRQVVADHVGPSLKYNPVSLSRGPSGLDVERGPAGPAQPSQAPQAWTEEVRQPGAPAHDVHAAANSGVVAGFTTNPSTGGPQFG